MDLDFNYWAVLVAAASSMVVGSIWYSKAVFGTKWMKAIGLSEESMKAGAAKALSVTLLLAIVTALVLSAIIDFMGAITWIHGIIAGLVVWGGFVFTSHVTNALFNQRVDTVLWIFLGNQLVTLIVMGLILAVWQ